MLTNQFIKFLDISILIKSGVNSKDIIKRTKVNQFVLNNFIKLSRKYSISDIVNIIDGFINIDYTSRGTSKVDVLYDFERYIISICLKK